MRLTSRQPQLKLPWGPEGTQGLDNANLQLLEKMRLRVWGDMEKIPGEVEQNLPP